MVPPIGGPLGEFRSKLARHSDLMSAGDSEVMSAIPILCRPLLEG
jgi:hypothetical protein